MARDSDVKRDVEAELKWDPVIDATHIAVAFRNGVVTLTGIVPSYAQLSEAEVIVSGWHGALPASPMSTIASRSACEIDDRQGRGPALSLPFLKPRP